jgi:hypothetical protein
LGLNWAERNRLQGSQRESDPHDPQGERVTVPRVMIVILVALALTAGACGDTSSETAPAPAQESTASDTEALEDRIAELESKVTREKARSKDRATRSEARGDTKATAATYVACDPNITVKATTTTCPFAQNVFYGYWSTGGADFSAYSPVSEQSYEMTCSDGATVICDAGDGAEVRFSMSAVSAYDQSQADSYASSHDLGPDIDTAHPSDHYSDDDHYSHHDDYSADQGYNDGDSVTEPGENIPYYDEGRGSRVECEDGTYSQSGGIQGACSHHGGVR